MTGTLHGTRGPFVAIALLLVSSAASAMDLTFMHAYGELVDRGSVTVHVSPLAAWDCTSSASVDPAGKRITLTGGAAPAGPPINCFAPWIAVLPPLPAGKYEVAARLVAASGAVVESVARSLEILPLEGRCNPDPDLRPTLLTQHATMTPEQIAARVANDPSYAARLGNPVVEAGPRIGTNVYTYLTYPPLVNPTEMSVRLVETGEFLTVDRNGWACLAAVTPDTVVMVVEFHHAGLDHYFYSGDASEIADIDAGKVGAWMRTGKRFRVTREPGCRGATTDTVVYRFNGIPAKGPNSHFFTRDRAECHVVDKTAQWALEGIPFFASPVQDDGTCAGTRIALYRMWRPFGDSNHRFTTERSVVSEMVAKGWVDEGAAMCVLPST